MSINFVLWSLIYLLSCCLMHGQLKAGLEYRLAHIWRSVVIVLGLAIISPVVVWMYVLNMMDPKIFDWPQFFVSIAVWAPFIVAYFHGNIVDARRIDQKRIAKSAH